MQERRQQCPICTADVMPISRYPDYVCEACFQQATNQDGVPVDFANEDISGGLIGYVLDARSKKFVQDENLTAKPVVLIRGIECYADEARFGGIVIRPRQN